MKTSSLNLSKLLRIKRFSKMSEIAFIVGHNERQKGALCKYFGMREYDFYNVVLEELGYLANFNFDVYRHDENIKGYNSRIKNTANQVNKKDYKLVISLHFNSVDNPQANGVECLYYFNSKLGKEYSNRFSNFMTSETGIKNRGAKALINKRDRGYAVVRHPNAPTILIEPFFGSNINDCKKIVDSCNLARILNSFCYSVINE